MLQLGFEPVTWSISMSDVTIRPLNYSMGENVMNKVITMIFGKKEQLPCATTILSEVPSPFPSFSWLFLQRYLFDGLYVL